MFKEINFSDSNIDNDEIIRAMEFNSSIAYKIKNEITVSKKVLNDIKKSNISSNITSENLGAEDTNENEIDYEFEDRVEFFLNEYMNIEEGFNDEELLDVLPFHNDQDILLRLCAESIKEINEIQQIILLDNLTKEDLNECLNIIVHEKRKIDIINKILHSSDETIELKGDEKNEIILAPSSNGRIRIISDLEGIPFEYYFTFKELIDSAIDGTFKGVRVFINNPALSGICELRKNKARILFKRISGRKYVLINAFIKKTTSDNGYLEFLKTRISSYKESQDSIKKLLSNNEFLSMNDEKIDELFSLLSCKEKNDSTKDIKVIRKAKK